MWLLCNLPMYLQRNLPIDCYTLQFFKIGCCIWKSERRSREAQRPSICYHEIEAYGPQTYIIYYLEEGNSKPFWQYIWNLRQDNISVSPLKNEGRLEPDRLQKAEILSRQFKSVFTNEDKISVDKLFCPNFPPTNSLVVSQKLVKLLSGLDVSKAAGPDDIPCRLPKGLSNDLATVLGAIFT